ncbi:hypothetical protein UlMin_027810 [Ulmus minor]
MEAKFGGNVRHLCGPVVSDLNTVGNKSLEWDLNDWKWDGDLFTATPSDCRSRQLFPLGPDPPATAAFSNSSSDIDPGADRGKRELEKRGRVVLLDDQETDRDSASLNFKLGGQAYPILEAEEKSGKKTKIVATTSNRPLCQVEDCRVDLSNAKDYHRRHKVCDIHSKATKALVGSVMQRFCQQCSRFHVLQEFDEGKRSCRRRLAGHNRRRRKTHPDPVVNGGSLNDERGSSYLLISLLRILTNMHSNNSDQTKDQDLLSHLLKSLANFSGSTVDARNISALLQGSQGLIDAGTSKETSQKAVDTSPNCPGPSRHFASTSKAEEPINNLEDPLRSVGQCLRVSSGDDGGRLEAFSGPRSTNPNCTRDGLSAKSITPELTGGNIKFNNIDLNNMYDDSEDHDENPGNSHTPINLETATVGNHLRMQHALHKSSPPQPSRNSDSTSTQSPSSSNGEAQSRTDRIVFKLFGKDPNDLPLVLRTQILDWLSHSPTDIESYIRPGCIILTIYLHLEKFAWDELCSDLGSSLMRLLAASNDPFWRTGWVYTRVQHRVAFMYNGQVVLDTPLPSKSYRNGRIMSIKPVAVPLSVTTQFVVKGFNLFRPSASLHCALDGKYLVRETCYDLMDGSDTIIEHEDIHCLRFSCSIPSVTGRGFIEVEDHGLSSSFFPFIVAEQEVVSEIRMLEGAIEAISDDVQRQPEMMKAKNQALDFIHEMGWLLHRSHVKFRLGHMDTNTNSDLFPFRRFRWLMEFSMDRDWCSVVNKLLGILFEGSVDAGEHSSVEAAILDIGLLHRAVKRNCRPMVELLLKFVPHNVLDNSGSKESQRVDEGYHRLLFKPDLIGPMGLTPVHLAASQDGCESVLDALTDDPGKVGIEVWKNARDNTGLTPSDYACLRSYYSYIHLVQRKMSKGSESAHVVVDIPGSVLDLSSKQKQPERHKSSKVASLETEKFETKARKQCSDCARKLVYGRRSSLVYRPALLSMVAIAAVCVCVALLFKSSPEVVYVFQPFRWERLKYGSI